MIILHGGITQGQFVIWGESPPEEASVAESTGSSKYPKPYPFDPGEAALVTALVEVLPELQWLDNASATTTGKSSDATFLWLPTLRGKPVASSPLIVEPIVSKSKPALKPWIVTAKVLTWEQTAALLEASLDRDTLAPALIIGSTLKYWTTVLRFTASLVTREQFLPSVTFTEDWQGHWQPAIAGEDVQRLNRLAKAMPAPCRAVNRSAETPPDVAPSAILGSFIGQTVDALVRHAVGVDDAIRKGKKETSPQFDSIHDQWIYALRSDDPHIDGDGTLQLANQVREWQRPVSRLVSSPFRLCFRLEEPTTVENGTIHANGKDKWSVHYFLQAQNDLSLLVPAADAWNPKGQTAKVLQKDGFRPREYLLATLGEAASLSPDIEKSLKSSAPNGFNTDTSGAYAFLISTARALEQAGFGVLLPAWWTRKGTKQRIKVNAKVKRARGHSSGALSLEELVKFEWQVALGDQKMTLAELEELAKLKVPLVEVRGQWVEVSHDELEKAIAFLKDKSTEFTVGELLRMELGAEPAPGGLEFTGAEATGKMQEFLDRLHGKQSFEELPTPEGFQGTLRPYQQRGFSWLAFLRQWGLGACLADDMGLGKTIQTLALLQNDWGANGGKKSSKKRPNPTLLICPTSVIGNWKREAERFTPELPVLVHHGPKREKGKTKFPKAVKDHAIVISSYALLHRDQEIFGKIQWGGVILDEAQNIKNPDTKQAKAARALEGEYRIALTGTPVENHIMELWSIWEFLNPGYLGKQAVFRRNFFVPIQLERDADAASRLKNLTGPFLLRRLKTDKTIISDLPEKQETKVFCNLTKEQASLYEAVVKDLEKGLSDAEGIQRKGLVLGTLSKLKQVCNHPAQFLGDGSTIGKRSGKLVRLTELIEEVLEVGDKALIFSQFKEMGEIIRKHLQETFGKEVLFLHGGVSAKNRDKMVQRFQDGDDGPPLFMLSLKAGGTGLNLTAGNHVFHFDRWWNPAVENQATDRAFRIGQKKNVLVHKFVCSGTLEEKIDEMIERKKEVADQVVGEGEAWLTELSNEELKELFKLNRDAVEE